MDPSAPVQQQQPVAVAAIAEVAAPAAAVAPTAEAAAPTEAAVPTEVAAPAEAAAPVAAATPPEAAAPVAAATPPEAAGPTEAVAPVAAPAEAVVPTEAAAPAAAPTEVAAAAPLAVDTSKFKQSLIAEADVFVQSAGLISFDEANKLWASACDGPGVTETEFATLSYILNEYKFTHKARTYLDPLVQKQTSGTSLYKQIKGVRYDRSCLDWADHFAKDGKIDLQDAKKLWEDVKDGAGVTETEKRTIRYIETNYTCTEGAKEYFDSMLHPKPEEPLTPRKTRAEAKADAEGADDAAPDTPSSEKRSSSRSRKAPVKFEPPVEEPKPSPARGKKRKAPEPKAKKAPAKKGSKKAPAKKKTAAKKKSKKEPTFCCGQPYDDAQFYMGCSSEADCKGVEWYHGACVGISQEKSKTMKDWFCEKCQDEPAESENVAEEEAPTSSIFDEEEDDDEDAYQRSMMEDDDEEEDQL